MYDQKISQSEIEKYGGSYSEESLWDKITGNAKNVCSHPKSDIISVL